ncbi:MAG: hypothetical protein LQ352_006202 [Teloschistes flavicans]|nr:MAG: hypothetical protein LQ352_006202 [Teloschistes flavicans]
MAGIGFNTRLPNTLLYMVLHYVPDLPTLINLTKAHPTIIDLAGKRYNKILSGVFLRSMHFELQRIALTLLSLRHGDHLGPMCLEDDTTALAAYRTSCLELYHPDIPASATASPTFSGPDDGLDSLWASLKLRDPRSAVEDIALYDQDIEYWVQSFVQSRCHRPTAQGPTDHPETPPSQLELYRIRRAFWRFFLLCEIAYPPQTGMTGRRPLHHEPALEFLARFQVWEFEELECIFRFLWDSYDALVVDHSATSSHPGHDDDDDDDDDEEEEEERTPSLLFDAIWQLPPLFRRLMLRMGYDLLENTPACLEEGDTLSMHLFPLVRPLISRHHPHPHPTATVVYPDAPSSSNEANAGYKYYCRMTDQRRAGHGYGEEFHEILGPDARYEERDEAICFQRWGYCVWDEERLEEWGVLADDVRDASIRSAQQGQPFRFIHRQFGAGPQNLVMSVRVMPGEDIGPDVSEHVGGTAV